jgi:hypothetical protein
MFYYNYQISFIMNLSSTVTFAWGVQDGFLSMHIHFLLFNGFKERLPSQTIYMCIKSIALGGWVVIAGCLVNDRQQWNTFFIVGSINCIIAWTLYAVFYKEPLPETIQVNPLRASINNLDDQIDVDQISPSITTSLLTAESQMFTS